jgi:hypothetical protein
MLTKIASKHMCNEKIYYIISCDRILFQIVNYNKAKKEEKYFQFVNVFHIIRLGKPIIDFESTCFVSISKGGEHIRQALNKQQWLGHGKVHK